jgi:hypothetical protein
MAALSAALWEDLGDEPRRAPPWGFSYSARPRRRRPAPPSSMVAGIDRRRINIKRNIALRSGSPRVWVDTRAPSPVSIRPLALARLGTRPVGAAVNRVAGFLPSNRR